MTPLHKLITHTIEDIHEVININDTILLDLCLDHKIEQIPLVNKDNTILGLITLKDIILSEIDVYYEKFQNEKCSFIEKWPAEKQIKGWHIMLKEHGYHHLHIHSDGWLSGVIYLKVVPPLKKNEGAIEFSLNGKYYHDAASTTVVHLPKAGDIVIFPSSLHHRTIPFSADTDRISIAFDLVPNSKKEL